MLDREQPYDLAVSFAGAQRVLVEKFVRACESLGLAVFYDRDVTAEMWGRDFIQEFRRVYGGELARYVVPFLSAEYFAGPYPMDELDAAIAYSIQRRNDVYLLPVTVGDVQIPENLVRSSVGFLRAEEYSAEELARVAVDRVRGTGGVFPPATPSVQVAAVRLPNVAPTSFSQFATLESGLARIGERFRQAAPELERFGYMCHVRVGDSSVDVRVEAAGAQVYGLAVRLQEWLGSDQLTIAYGWSRTLESGINGWAGAEWDASAGEGRLRFSDLSGGGMGRMVSADELFDVLWSKVVEYIEQTRGRRA